MQERGERDIAAREEDADPIETRIPGQALVEARADSAARPRAEPPRSARPPASSARRAPGTARHRSDPRP